MAFGTGARIAQSSPTQGGGSVTQEDIAKLQAYLRRYRVVNPQRWRQGAQVVANDLANDAAFTDIKVAAFLESPDGKVIAQVVQSVLPFPGAIEAGVMIEAIEIASKRQTVGQRVGALLIGALAVLLLWGLFRDW